MEEALPWPFTPPKADVYLPGFPSIKSTNFEPLTTSTTATTTQSVARPRNIDGQRFNSVENNGVDITERSTTKFISTTTENHRKNDRRNNVRAISVPSGGRKNQPVCMHIYIWKNST